MKRSVPRRLLLIALLVTSLALLAGCAAQAPQTTAAPTAEAAASATAAPTAAATDAMPAFTAQELAKYDGQNGNPAYIAVDGVVYDVSNVPQWRNGSHFGRFQAGKDLTTEIKTVSPHGVSKLVGLPVVGTYEP